VDWGHKVQHCYLGVTGHIFAIRSQRSLTGCGSVLKLKVNFLPKIITLSKEVGLIEFTDPESVCVWGLCVMCLYGVCVW
jgi:hypothetical protein